MAGPLIFDRVMESSQTTGTGPYTLTGAVAGFSDFGVLGTGNSCHYCAQAVDAVGNPTGAWEIGLGTYTAPNVLSRDTIYASTTANGVVNWATGMKRVFLCQPAATAIESDRANTFSQPQRMTAGLDLLEGVPTSPSADAERLYALDVNGYTQVEMKDSAGRGARLASDNILIAKITEPTGVTRGQLVYLAGASGANPLIRLAKADALATIPTIGVVLDTGANNAFTRVLLSGTIQGLNTSAFTEGVPLFVSPTTAGALTSTVPLTPNYAQRVGFATRSHATQGELLVLTTAVVNDPRLHAATHAAAGSDPVTVTALAGYPGGTTFFLRADGSFSTPPMNTGPQGPKGDPGPQGPAGPDGGTTPHHTRHEPGGSDPLSNVVWTDAGGNVVLTGFLYPGQYPSGGPQGSYYLAGSTQWGLYSNTSLYTQGFYGPVMNVSGTATMGAATINGAATISGALTVNSGGASITGYSYLFQGGGTQDVSLFLYNTTDWTQVRIMNYQGMFRLWREDSFEMFTVDRAGNGIFAGNLNCGALASSGVYGRQGTTGQYGQQNNFYWTGSGLQYWVANVYVADVGLSDRRLKKDIEPLRVGLAEVLKLQPKQFRWRDNPQEPGTQFGLLAQDVTEVLPQITRQLVGLETDDAPDGPWRLDYVELVPVLVQAVQELEARNATLEDRLKNLEARLAKIERM